MYNNFFWYPKKGGIEELIEGFSQNLNNINLNSQAKTIDLIKKKVVFKDGREESFVRLISTIPLPELGKMLTPLPDDIAENFKKLKWISIYNVNLGTKARPCPPRHWAYFSQRNIPFFRAGFFHNFSSCLAPTGRGAIYADVSYSKDRPIQKSIISARIIKHLRIVGIIDSEDEICCEHINDIRYGYPIYDKEYEQARKRILNFLSGNSIITSGRYGSWRYLSMEDVIIEAENNAKGVR